VPLFADADFDSESIKRSSTDVKAKMVSHRSMALSAMGSTPQVIGDGRSRRESLGGHPKCTTCGAVEKMYQGVGGTLKGVPPAAESVPGHAKASSPKADAVNEAEHGPSERTILGLLRLGWT